MSPSKTKLRCNNQHPDVLSITKINVQTVKTVETNIMANSERFVFKNLWLYKKYFVRFLFNNYILAGLYWSLIPPKVSFLGSVKKKKETIIMANSERFVFKNLWSYKKYFVLFLFNNYRLAGLYWSLIPPTVSFLGSVQKKIKKKGKFVCQYQISSGL